MTKHIMDMTEEELITSIREALKPEFEKMNDKMVTKEEFKAVTDLQADKFVKWFLQYSDALKELKIKVEENHAEVITRLNNMK